MGIPVATKFFEPRSPDLESKCKINANDQEMQKLHTIGFGYCPFKGCGSFVDSIAIIVLKWFCV